VNAEGACVFACALEEPAPDPWLAPAWFCFPARLCAPIAFDLPITDLLPPVREPRDAPERAPEAGCPPAGEREARMPPDRALPGELANAGASVANPGSAVETKLFAAELCVEAEFGAPIDPPPPSRQTPPG
jgi:hypothetical protein